MRYFFPKSHRLRKRAEFLSVQRAGKTQHGRYFVLVSSNAGRGRLGITVSKKVGNAVVRNRVKRLVREFARTSQDVAARWLPANVDAVVIAKSSAAQAPTAHLWADLDRLRATLRASA